MGTPHSDAKSPDEDLGELRGLPSTIASEFADWQPNWLKGGAPEDIRPPAHSALNEAEIQYLRAVIDQPGKPSSAYPTVARIGTRRALRIRTRLVDLGYIREHTVNTASRGRPSIILEPTALAHEELGEGPQGEAEGTE